MGAGHRGRPGGPRADRPLLGRGRPASAPPRPGDGPGPRPRADPPRLPGAGGLRGLAAVAAQGARRGARTPASALGRRGAPRRRRSRRRHVPRGARTGRVAVPARHRGAARPGRAHAGARVGRHDGAHRGWRRIGRGRHPHPRLPGARRLLVPGGRQAVHHRWGPRPDREHRALRPGPALGRAGRGRPRYEGPVALPRTQVPLRPGHRRTPRPQRGHHHAGGEQDGPGRLGHLRTGLRRRRHGQGPCWATCTTGCARCSTRSAGPA